VRIVLANTAKQFDPGKGDGGGVEVLETEHGTSSGFDAAMVRFNQIVNLPIRQTSHHQGLYPA
jgi:hypothetical protein